MQQTPKYLRIQGNGTDRKIDMSLISGSEYSAHATIDGGNYEISIEYADGTIAAPYLDQTLQLSPLNPKYTHKGLAVATPAQIQLPNRYTIEVRHNISNAEISIEATDLVNKISGHVWEGKSPVPNAWISTAPIQPVEQEINNGFNSRKGYYLLYGRKNIEFTPTDGYITKVGFYMYGRGNTQGLVVSVIDKEGTTVCEKAVAGSQIVNNGWTTVDFGGSVKVSAGEKNILSISYPTTPASSAEMYYYGQNDNSEFAYKITTCNVQAVRTNDDGAYTISVGNPFSGCLYAYHPNTPAFAPLYLTNVNTDMTGQDFNTATSITFATITGKVTDGNSNPVPYASISTTSNFAADNTIKASYDGTYAIKVDKNFSGKIYATAQNYGSANISLSNITGNVTDKNIKLTNNLITITGKIIDTDSKDFPGALVSTSADMTNSVKTTAAGTFSIVAPINSDVIIYVKADGCDFTPKAIKTSTADIADIQIQELPKYVAISGKVLDANNKPMEGVFITTTNQKPQEKLDVDVTQGTISYTFFGKETDFTFTPTQNFITKINLQICKQDNPGDIVASITDMDGNTAWTKTFTQSEILNEFKVNAQVIPNATYRMRLTYQQPSSTDFYFYAKTSESNGKILHQVYTTNATAVTNPNGEYTTQVRRHSQLSLYAFSDNNEYDPLKIADAATDLTGQDFKAKASQPKTYTISGKITDEKSAAISGAKVSLSAANTATMTVTTASDGAYSFTVNEGFSGTITVQYDGYTFAETTISNVKSNIANKNIKGEKIIVNYTIAGKATDDQNKAIQGATITITPSNGAQQTATTDRNGAYSFTINEGLSGIIDAAYDGYSFQQITFSKLTANLANQNFKGTKIIVYAQINGVVKDQNSNPLSGVLVSVNSDMKDATTTNSNGEYSLQVDDQFSGKIYAKIDGYEIAPITIKNATGTLQNQNLTANEIIDEKSTVYITGRVFDKQYNPVEGAEVYTTTDGVPELKLDIEKSDDAGNCYYMPNADYASNYSYSAFTAKAANIGRVEFKAFYGGQPGNMSVAIIDANKAVVAETSLASSQVKNDDWTAADLNAKLTPGAQYFIVLKASKANSGSNYYAYYDSKDNDGMLFRTYALVGGETKQTVKTSADGSYIFEANVGENVKLYAAYANLTYQPKTYQQLRYDIPSQDFVPDGAVMPATTATISGHVYDQRHKGIAGAIVTQSSKSPYVLCSQEDCTTCYSFSEHDVSFKATDNYITQLDFMISKTGTPGSLTVSILNAAKLELWSKTFANDETTAWQWKEVFIDNSLAITPGEYYYIRLTAQNTNGTYYYVMNNNYDMAYRLWTNDAPCVKSDDSGAYTYTATQKSGSLHAYYEDITFNTVTYANLTQNLADQNFGIFTSAGILREKNVSTPVSEIQPGKTSPNAAARVWSYEKTIVIETIAGTQYSIIDAAGRVIKQGKTSSTHDETAIAHQGIYVVIINHHPYKVMIH